MNDEHQSNGSRRDTEIRHSAQRIDKLEERMDRIEQHIHGLGQRAPQWAVTVITILSTACGILLSALVTALVA